MSMRYYGIEGYGFDEPCVDFEKAMHFLWNEAPVYVKEAFKSWLEKTGNPLMRDMEMLCDACCDCFNVNCPSAILAETITHETGFDVQCIMDDDAGYKILLLPYYPWQNMPKIDKAEDYEKIAGELAEKFYGVPVQFNYDCAVYYG